VRDNGTALGAVAAEIAEFVTASGSSDSDGRFKEELALLGTALDDVQMMVGRLVGFAMASQRDARAIYQVGEHAVSLLMSAGDLLIGYLLLRQALVAQAALDAGTAGERDTAFYTGKLAVAHWFTRNVLPELSARRAVIEAADLSLMDVPETAF
jgi:hypothetical protein